MSTANSRLILGIWRIADWQMRSSQVADLVEGCLDIGIDTFDLADIYADYRCEALFGEALASRPALKSRIKLISKCGIALVSPNRPQHRVKHYNTSSAHIVASAEHSLAQMGGEQLEMLLIHRPDPLMDADEIAEAFFQLKQAGKVAQFGVSNFLPHQLELLQSRLDEPLAANQVEVSLLHTDTLFDGTLDQCQRLRIKPQAWSPLGGGRLSAEPVETPLGQVLTRLGAELGVSREQLAIAWLLRHPAGIQPVLGSGKLDRLQQLAAAQEIVLDRQQWFELLEAAMGRPMP
ncbi:aldo/keto reductase [Chitinimonas sp. JJ19]|uniref:aldo/keto reductase n=1 Tax=Chitinimonas sp. JJ19 TaxID=3109352 RepID=UPI0030030471